MNAGVKLSTEQREALRQSENQLVEIENEEIQERFLLISKSKIQELLGDRIVAELQGAINQIANGEGESWDREDFLSRMHKEHGTFIEYPKNK